MNGTLQVVVGGQYGSEGKGAIAAHLSKGRRNLIAVRTGGPNAGHTVWDKGKEWKLRCLPTAAVSNPDAQLMIAPDSEIDNEVLALECDALQTAGYDVYSRLIIDENATMIEDAHKQLETALINKIGSTGKGIGAARAEHIMRRAELFGGGVNVPVLLMHHMALGGDVLLEGSQGFGLGLHAGHYPHCTSRNCTAMDVMAGAGLSPWASYVRELQVWVVMRTYPIRVAGNSGPLENEMTWEQVGQAEERTTVTNKVRRVAAWDPELAAQAIMANGGPSCRVALTMADYIESGLWGKTTQDMGQTKEIDNKIRRVLWKMESDLAGAKIWMLGTSPETVIETGPWRS